MTQRRLLPALALILLGLVVGGVLGKVVGSLGRPSYTSVGVVTLQPDSAVGTTSASGSQNTSSPDATTFVQGELVVLNGTPLRDQVGRQLRLPSRPSVSSSQIGTTFSVTVTATASTQEQAQAVAQSTIATYAQGRVQSLLATVTAAQASVRQQLSQVQGLISAGTTPTTQPSSALESQYQTLLSLSSNLAFTRTQAPKVVQTVQAPTPQGTTSSTTRNVFLGALLGGILAVGLVLARRASVRTVQSAEDLQELSAPLLLPVVPRLSRRAASSGRHRTLRLLSARLGPREAQGPSAIIVTGATPQGGASMVSAAVAGYLAERGPVLLVLAAEGGREAAARVGVRRPTRGINDLTGKVDEAAVRRLAVQTNQPGVRVLTSGSAAPNAPQRLRRAVNGGLLEAAMATGSTVVVDAPALTSSTVALDLGRRAGRGVVLVVGSGVARPEDVLAATEIFDASGIALEGIVLNRPRRRTLLTRVLGPLHRRAAPSVDSSAGARSRWSEDQVPDEPEGLAASHGSARNGQEAAAGAVRASGPR